MRARFAYQLASSGFGVVTDIANLDAAKPDVIVAELVATRHDGTASITNISHDRRLRGIPVIAIADDVSDLTQTLAGQGGCAAVCLTTCSVTALTSGIHAVLNLRDG
jgi:DNA-binding NarL/FixJ family response regulator